MASWLVGCWGRSLPCLGALLPRPPVSPGTGLCNQIWGSTYVASSNSSACMSFWFWGGKNPNAWVRDARRLPPPLAAGGVGVGCRVGSHRPSPPHACAGRPCICVLDCVQLSDPLAVRVDAAAVQGCIGRGGAAACERCCLAAGAHRCSASSSCSSRRRGVLGSLPEQCHRVVVLRGRYCS